MRHWKPELLEQLLLVQEIDLKIRALDDEILSIYRKSKEEDQLLAQLKRNQERIEESIITCEAQHEMYVGTLEDIRTAIKGLATTKSGAPKPRTRSSTEALRAEEEKLTALVFETEEQTKQLAEERINIAKQIEDRSEEVERLQQGPEAEIRKLRNKIKKFEKQRTDAVQGMPSMLLRKYDRLRSSRSGIGLTTLKDGVCLICRMKMPTAIEARLNNGHMIPSCPACGRMVAKVLIKYNLPTASDSIDAAPEVAAEKTSPKAKTKKGAAKASAASKKDGGSSDEKDTADKKSASAAPSKSSKAAKSTKKKETKKTAAKKTTKKAAAKKESVPPSPASKKSEVSSSPKQGDETVPPGDKAEAASTDKKATQKKTAAKKTTKKTTKKTGATKKSAAKKTTEKSDTLPVETTAEPKKPAKKTTKKAGVTKKAAAKKTTKKAAKKAAPVKSPTPSSSPQE